jgi:hypothetical protein
VHHRIFGTEPKPLGDLILDLFCAPKRDFCDAYQEMRLDQIAIKS